MKAYDDVQDDVDDLVGDPAADVPKVRPDERCRGKKTDRREDETVFAGYCGAWAGRGTDHVGEGRCKHHAGSSTGPTSEEGKETSSKNAVTHGAYAESFLEYLTDEEIERINQAQEILDTPEGAQDHARLMASLAVEQYRRSQDERFLRRYEALCDKAGIFPAEEIDHGGDVELTLSLSPEEKEQLDEAFNREVQQ
jgi:tryptophan synthase beta subunit